MTITHNVDNQINIDDNDKIIRECLETIGLSTSEQDVFLLLAETESPWPTTGIALELDTARQTMYSTLRSMTTRKLLTETKQRNVPYFQIDLNHINKYVIKKCDALHTAQKTLTENLFPFRKLFKSHQQ